MGADYDGDEYQIIGDKRLVDLIKTTETSSADTLKVEDLVAEHEPSSTLEGVDGNPQDAVVQLAKNEVYNQQKTNIYNDKSYHFMDKLGVESRLATCVGCLFS